MSEPRDREYWAKPVEQLHVGDVDPKAPRGNVEGRRVNTAMHGFGQMWQKTYRARIPARPRRRRLLHKRAAEALESRPRSHTDARLATAAAAHFRSAGSDDASEWYLLAGDLSREVFAYDEAVAAYETAIALGHAHPGSIRLALGELAMARGDYGAALRELRAAAAHSTGSTLAVVEHRTGNLHRLLGRFDLADESFMRAEPDHPEPSELYADWALLKHRLGDSEEAMALANRALDVSEDDERGRARGLNILGVVTPDPALAMAHIDEALELAG